MRASLSRKFTEPVVMVSLSCSPLPMQGLALTNRVHVHPTDSNAAGVAGRYIAVGEKQLVFRIAPCEAVARGCFALSSVQRRAAGVALGDVCDFSGATDDVDVQGRFPATGICEMQVKCLAARSDVASIDVAVLVEGAGALLGNDVLFVGQAVVLDADGTTVQLVCTRLMSVPSGESLCTATLAAGRVLVGETRFAFTASSTGSGRVLLVNGGAAALAVPPPLFDRDFDFGSLGIGGLDTEFATIFRRAFASRLYPSLVRDMGIHHVKGMLLYGPPGCGKTLIARRLGQALHCVEPKKVNGPEVLNKYVGESEANIRALFRDAEADQADKGDSSPLHIIIFDEIDAICRRRGGDGGGGAMAGVGDSIVNQLLSKIDGVDALNNILLIGMTNRKDLIDDALLRPGRLEVHVQVGLPDAVGRAAILGIHTQPAASSGRLAADVDIPGLSQRTVNFTGAELEGLVRNAASYALLRLVDGKDVTRVVEDTSAVSLTAADFERALAETVPQFGAAATDLEACAPYGVVDFSPDVADLLARMGSAMRAKLPVLLTGRCRSGKSALAATAVMRTGAAYQRRVSPHSLLGMSDGGKVDFLTRVFTDAARSTAGAAVLLDDIEDLVEYVAGRFNSDVLHALCVLVARYGNSVAIVATSAAPKSVLRALRLHRLFALAVQCPTVASRAELDVLLDAYAVETGSPALVEAVVTWLPIGVKQLVHLLELARQDGEESDVKSGVDGSNTPARDWLGICEAMFAQSLADADDE